MRKIGDWSTVNSGEKSSAGVEFLYGVNIFNPGLAIQQRMARRHKGSDERQDQQQQSRTTTARAQKLPCDQRHSVGAEGIHLSRRTDIRRHHECRRRPNEVDDDGEPSEDLRREDADQRCERGAAESVGRHVVKP